jgi:hypothetical protein
MDLVNLSLATAKRAHAALLEEVTRRTGILIAPSHFAGIPAYPGSFPWVFGVSPDLNVDRQSFGRAPDGVFLASPYPRELPGLSVHENFSGSSFAVANFSRSVCRLLVHHRTRIPDELRKMLSA